MKTITLSKEVSFSAYEYAGQGNAILGIRDSGKSYSATYFAERLLDAKIPFIAFDPIGVWRFLKTPGTGAGYPIVVAGGDCGDLSLTPQSAPEIVRAAMHDNIPLVLDLYTMEMSKADWHRIVASCVRLLLYENKTCGLRHIFLEEAAEFCPQLIQPDQRVVYSEIEKLARMGGNASLGYTLINQRAEQLNKAVLELCDCLFLHRQKGRNSLTALSKWLHLGDSSRANDIIKRMPSLSQGECFAWLPGSESPEFVQMPKKRTFHPDRRKPELREKAERQNLDVSSFVGQLQKTLPKLVEQAKENDPKELRAEVAKLRAELAKKPISAAPAAKPVDPKWLESVIKEASEEACTQGATVGFHKGVIMALERVTAVIGDLDGKIPCPYQMPKKKGVGDTITFTPTIPKLATDDYRTMRRFPHDTSKQPEIMLLSHKTSATQTGDVTLPKGERIVLTAIAQNLDRPTTREELTVLTGYKRSARDTYIQRLASRGLIDTRDHLRATPEGIAVLGADFQPLPTGRALFEHWMLKLPQGERRVLEFICQSYPRSSSREDISECLGYKRSARDTYIQRLSARRLIETQGRGEVCASSLLF